MRNLSFCRFSIRTLLVLVFVVAVVLAISSHRVRSQNRVIDFVRSLDGHVWNVSFKDDRMILPDHSNWLPRFLVPLVPKSLNYIYLPVDRVTDAELDIIISFPNLEGLQISKSRITDDGLRKLARCTGLVELCVEDVGVSDAALLEFQSAVPNCNVVR